MKLVSTDNPLKPPPSPPVATAKPFVPVTSQAMKTEAKPQPSLAETTTKQTSQASTSTSASASTSPKSTTKPRLKSNGLDTIDYLRAHYNNSNIAGRGQGVGMRYRYLTSQETARTNVRIKLLSMLDYELILARPLPAADNSPSRNRDYSIINYLKPNIEAPFLTYIGEELAIFRDNQMLMEFEVLDSQVCFTFPLCLSELSSVLWSRDTMLLVMNLISRKIV
jgi:hypothetical protein